MSSEQIADMVASGPPMRSLLLYFKTPQPCRFWTGVGPLEIDGGDAFDGGGAYSGTGVIKDWPSLRGLTGGRAERVDFTFNPDHVSVDGLFDDPIRAPVHVGLVMFRRDGSFAGPVAWLWSGLVDQPGEVRSGINRSLVLSCISGAANRARSAQKYWSNRGHQSRAPGDAFFSETQGLTINSYRRW